MFPVKKKIMPTEAEQTIAKVFYDRRKGFGSLEDTYRQAKELDRSITRAQVKSFLANQEVRQQKKPAKNEVNSFVADFPRQEFQVDLMDLGKWVKPFRYGFVAYDIFSKKGACIPIRAKEPRITAKALKEVFHTLGYPSSIMCDDGSEFKGEFAQLCKEQQVDIIKAITGARFVERFIRSLKSSLRQRMYALGDGWEKYIHDVVDKYNETVHSSTGKTPDDVAENEYDFDKLRDVHNELVKHAKFNTKHPTVSVRQPILLSV